MMLYFGALVLINLIFLAHSLPLLFMVFGSVEVIYFFYFSNTLTKKWGTYSTKKFTNNLFYTAFFLRLAWVLFSYIFYSYMYGEPFEFEARDSHFYDESAVWIHHLLDNHQGFKPFLDSLDGGYSDAGYAIYLGVQYFFTGNSILIARILKAAYGAYTCILIYKFAIRNFGEEVARMAAIFCMLMPSLIYYCGLQLKETEMLLLVVWFMERVDAMLRNKNYNFVEIAPPLVLAGLLFFFRTTRLLKSYVFVSSTTIFSNFFLLLLF